MASPPVIDLDKLLLPIPGASPTGENMRAGSSRDLYDAIRGARAVARNKEKPQMMGDPTAPPGPPEDWRVVQDKSIEAIASKSKDLEISVYLIEALCRYEGFAGLRDGFRLYRELCNRFWDALYPPLESEGPAARVSAMGGLIGGVLLFPIQRIALTESKSSSYGLLQHQTAAALDQLPPEKQDERIRNGQVSRKMFEDSAAQTPTAFYRTLLDDLNECLQEFDSLVEILDAKCGREAAPPSTKIRDALTQCLDIVAAIAKPRLESETEKPKTPGAGPGAPSGGGTAVQVPGTFRTREEAFDAVQRIAQFFRDTEPQSPVIYSLEQVVRWGKMPLPELLTELIGDEGVRTRLFQMVGIRPPPPAGGT